MKTFWIGTTEPGFSSTYWRKVKTYSSSRKDGTFVAEVDMPKPHHERTAEGNSVETAVDKLATMLSGKSYQGSRPPID